MSDKPGMAVPTLAEIVRTAGEIAPYVMRTPIHEWRGREIEAALPAGTRPVLKLELFQYSGTFKARGAIKSVLAMDAESLQRGITAVSAGNHAIAAAYAAHCIGTSAKVVMFASAEPIRIERARAYGAEVVLAGSGAEAFDIANEIAEREGRTFVHPFEGPYVALGTGTLGVEFMEQAESLDALIVPIGGGGLCAGVSTAAKHLDPDCRIYGVEPAGADTMYRSFAAGAPQARERIDTIADSLAAPYALPYSFELCRRNVERVVLVEDDEIRRAMKLLLSELKLAVEPAAAAATAALLGPLKDELASRRVGLIMCGTNMSLEKYSRLLSS